MRTLPILAALLAAATTLPALSQTAPANPTPLPYDRGYDKDSPRTEAINAVEAPETRKLNEQSDASATASSDAALMASTDAKAQYQIDREAYWAALQQHDQSVQRTDNRYVRQQNAYADAMQAWRVQAAACKRGNQRACNAPTPNPAGFY